MEKRKKFSDERGISSDESQQLETAAREIQIGYYGETI